MDASEEPPYRDLSVGGQSDTTSATPTAHPFVSKIVFILFVITVLVCVVLSIQLFNAVFAIVNHAYEGSERLNGSQSFAEALFFSTGFPFDILQMLTLFLALFLFRKASSPKTTMSLPQSLAIPNLQQNYPVEGSYGPMYPDPILSQSRTDSLADVAHILLPDEATLMARVQWGGEAGSYVVPSSPVPSRGSSRSGANLGPLLFPQFSYSEERAQLHAALHASQQQYQVGRGSGTPTKNAAPFGSFNEPDASPYGMPPPSPGGRPYGIPPPSPGPAVNPYSIPSASGSGFGVPSSGSNAGFSFTGPSFTGPQGTGFNSPYVGFNSPSLN